MKNGKYKCECDEGCGELFHPEFKQKVVDENNGIKITYICCPKCGKKYFSGITDFKYEELLKTYREKAEKIRKAVKRNSNYTVIAGLTKAMNNYEKNTLNPYYSKLRAEGIEKLKQIEFDF